MLLIEVRRDLAGFLDAVHPWARDVVPGLADPFTAAVDKRLRISRSAEQDPPLWADIDGETGYEFDRHVDKFGR
ncbi:hypothetical protein [Actinoplanes sp. NPDC051494]|uniref:hypothetical protein n=1 Tax=Actinoplanes sp. NPDC051494 TaxID=3363907 RepID=UPI003799AFAF